MTTATPDGGARPPTALLGYPSYLLSRVGAEGRRRAASAVAMSDLRLNSAAVLACLGEFGPSPQRDLVERLRIDPSDVVAVVDDLETRGFVVRQPCDVDRRRHIVRLTAEGRRARAATARALEQVQADLLAPLTEPERGQLVDMLRRLLSHHGG